MRWLSILTFLMAPQGGGAYHITHTYSLGGDGTWDYRRPGSAEPSRVHRAPDAGDGR
jgi:hypothetical protein